MEIEIVLKSLLDQDPSLTELDITLWSGIDPAQPLVNPPFEELGNAFKFAYYVRVINLSHAQDYLANLSLEAFKNLCIAIQNIPNLQILRFCRSYFGILPLDRFQMLCTAIQNSRNLQTLELSYCSLYTLSLTYTEMLTTTIQNIPYLQTLRLDGNRLVDIKGRNIETENFEKWCTAIRMAPHLQILSLSVSSLGELDPTRLKMLFTAIQEMPFLDTLDLSHNNIAAIDETTVTAECFQMLFTAVQTAPYLRELNLSGNKIGTLGSMRLKMVCTAIQEALHLENLDLSDNSLASLNETSTDTLLFQMLFTAIQTAPHLRELNLSRNKIGTLGPIRFKIFCMAIQTTLHLENLLLSKNELDSLPFNLFEELFDAIRNATQLRTLDLATFQVRSLGILNSDYFQKLCTTIQTATQIQNLNLSSNPIHFLSKVLSEISDIIQKASHLRTLCLSRNDLGGLVRVYEKSFQKLCIAIQTSSIHTLDLSSCELSGLSPEAFQMLFSAIQMAPQLQHLNLSYNSLTFLGIQQRKMLFTALQSAFHLQTLNLIGNDIYDYQKDFIEELTIALNNHPSLMEIKAGAILCAETILRNQSSYQIKVLDIEKEILNDFLNPDVIQLCQEYLCSSDITEKYYRYYAKRLQTKNQNNLMQTAILFHPDGTVRCTIEPNPFYSPVPTLSPSVSNVLTTNAFSNENDIKIQDEHNNIIYVDDQEVKIINDIPQIPQNVDQLIPANASTHEPNFASGVDQALEAAIQASLASYNDNAPKNESNFDHDLNAAIQESLKSVTQAISINQPNISNNINSQSSYTQPIRFTQNNNATNNSANTPQDKPENKADGLENKGNLSNATASLSANIPSNSTRREAWLNSLGSKLKPSHRPEAG